MTGGIGAEPHLSPRRPSHARGASRRLAALAVVHAGRRGHCLHAIGGCGNPVARDAFRFGLYTGMRRAEVFGLTGIRTPERGWAWIPSCSASRYQDRRAAGVFRYPPARRHLERRLAEREHFSERSRRWVFPSDISKAGHLEGVQYLNARIGEAGGAWFWFHALRNCFITVADRELMLPASLTKRLVNHARSQDVTEGYAADWTMDQLRESAQKIADRIDLLTSA